MTAWASIIHESASRLGRPALALAVSSMLAACVTGEGASPAVPSGSGVAPRTGIQVSIDGAALLGELRQGAAGKVLGRAGAQSVAGLTIYLRAATVDGKLAGDQGRLAKRGAEAVCLEAGGRFNPRAIGGYDGSIGWLFPGACA